MHYRAAKCRKCGVKLGMGGCERCQKTRTEVRMVEYAALQSWRFRAGLPTSSDGFFIGQDRKIKPYASTNLRSEPRYPATPLDAIVLPYQVEHSLAERLVKILNERKAEA